MSDGKTGPERFAQKYADSYPHETQYRRLNDTLECKSSAKFQVSRKKLIKDLATHEGEETGMSHALLSEFVVELAINPLIQRRGYRVDMAPQSVEGGGKKQRGVDLLIVDKQDNIMMGIDIKLRKTKTTANRNGGGWLENLSAPFINLTLGNWPVKAKDESVQNVKQWLVKSVVPNISEGGQIPNIASLRSFAVTRIKNSLVSQLDNLESEHPNTTARLPVGRQEGLACKQKLKGLIEVFETVEKDLAGSSVKE